STLERIEATARRRCEFAAHAQQREAWREIAGLARAARDGGRDAARGLWLALFGHEGEIGLWDSIVLGTWTIEHDEPGEERQTVGDAPPGLWRSAAPARGPGDPDTGPAWPPGGDRAGGLTRRDLAAS